MNWAGAEENEFPLFGSREEIHETGVKLVHMRLDLWPGGERHFINDLEVFWLRVEKQMKVQKKIEMRKNDLMSQIVIFFSFNSWMFFNPIVFSFLSWLLCRITRNKPCRRICLTKATPKCSRALGSRTVEGTTLYFISMNVALVHFCVCALMSELVLLKNGPLTYLASRTCRHLRMILLVWTSPYNLPNHCFNILSHWIKFETKTILSVS